MRDWLHREAFVRDSSGCTVAGKHLSMYAKSSSSESCLSALVLLNSVASQSRSPCSCASMCATKSPDVVSHLHCSWNWMYSEKARSTGSLISTMKREEPTWSRRSSRRARLRIVLAEHR